MSASASTPRPGLTSVIVVAADSGSTLIDGVADVLSGTADVEIIVSDNASQDGSIELLRSRFGNEPRVRILRNGKNLGFGAGVNRAATIALGDAIFLLNPDCRVDAQALSTLRDIAARTSALGVLGPKIVDAQGAVEPAARRRDPTLRRALATLFGKRGDEGVNLAPRLAGDPSEEIVDAVSGAAMWIPRAAFERLGGFDEKYFLHCEDLDLCRRARDAGLAVLYTDAVSIVHAKGGSSRHRPVFVSWHKHRGMWRWFARHDPAARHIGVRAVVWCGIWAHFFATAPRRYVAGLRSRHEQASR